MNPTPRCSATPTASGSLGVSRPMCKDLAARLAEADAQYLVVDNSAALMLHREVKAPVHASRREATELMDTLWNTDRPRACARRQTLPRRTHRQPEIDLRLFRPAAWTASTPQGSSWSGPTLRGFGSLRTARSRRPTSTDATHDSSRRWTTTSSSKPAAVCPAATGSLPICGPMADLRPPIAEGGRGGPGRALHPGARR